MKGRKELEEALYHIDTLHNPDNGTPWNVMMEQEGIDPNAVLDCSAEHAETLVIYGVIDNNQREPNAISFGAGFTLAIVLMRMERENNA